MSTRRAQQMSDSEAKEALSGALSKLQVHTDREKLHQLHADGVAAAVVVRNKWLQGWRSACPFGESCTDPNCNGSAVTLVLSHGGGEGAGQPQPQPQRPQQLSVAVVPDNQQTASAVSTVPNHTPSALRQGFAGCRCENGCVCASQSGGGGGGNSSLPSSQPPPSSSSPPSSSLSNAAQETTDTSSGRRPGTEEPPALTRGEGDETSSAAGDGGDGDGDDGTASVSVGGSEATADSEVGAGGKDGAGGGEGASNSGSGDGAAVDSVDATAGMTFSESGVAIQKRFFPASMTALKSIMRASADKKGKAKLVGLTKVKRQIARILEEKVKADEVDDRDGNR